MIARRRTAGPSWTSFCELREALRGGLDVPCSNPHGSLEALNGGYHAALIVGAVFAAAAATIGGVFLRTRMAPHAHAEAERAQESPVAV